MNIGTMNIDNLMESITEEEAMELVYQLTKKFDWKGTLFYSADLDEYVDTCNEDWDVYEEADRVTVEEVKATRMWQRHMDEILTSEGFDCLSEAVFEAKQNKKGK